MPLRLWMRDKKMEKSYLEPRCGSTTRTTTDTEKVNIKVCVCPLSLSSRQFISLYLAKEVDSVYAVFVSSQEMSSLSSSSSSCRATSTDIPDPLLPLLHIVHRFWQVFWATSRVLRAAVCRFELVALIFLGHMRGLIGVHHLWPRTKFSSSVLHVWFL